MRPFLVLTIGLLLSTVIKGKAQSLNFKQFSSKDGVPSKVVFNMFQDSKGYVWASTLLGIVKHNGQSFVPVCTNRTIRETNMYAVTESPDKTIYFSTNVYRIFKIRNDSAIYIPEIDSFSQDVHNAIIDLAVEKEEDIWFSSFSGSYHFIQKTRKTVKISTSNSTAPFTVEAKQIGNKIFFIRNNFSDKNSLFKYSLLYLPGEKTPLKIPALGLYSRLHLQKKGKYHYFSNGSTIYKISENKILDSCNINGIIDIKTNSDGNFWVFTATETRVLSPSFDSVTTHMPGNVLFDRSGGVWMYSLGGGIRYSRNQYEQKIKHDADPENEITRLFKNNGFLHFATAKGGVYEHKGYSFKKLYQFEKPVEVIRLHERDDKLLIGCRHGLFHLLKKTNELKEIKDERNLALGIFYFTEVAPDTLFGRCGTSLLIMHNNKVIDRNILGIITHAIGPYDKNHVLLANVHGLWKYNWRKHLFTPVDTSHYEHLYSTSCITVDRFKNIWIGRQTNGITVKTVDGKTIELENCPFVLVNDLQFYKNIVIASTNMGVFKSSFSKTNFPKSWDNITPMQASGMVLKENIIWVSTQEGLLSFDVEKLDNQSSYPVILSSIMANGSPVDIQETKFNHSQNDLRFNFDFLNYKWPVNGFFFSLSGPTQLSGHITGNVLQVQNLEPGTYSLKVFPLHGKAFNKTHFLEKSFSIYPAYWQTMWFKVLIPLVAVTLTALSVTLILRGKRKRATQTAEMNKLLAEHTLTALKAQINPHFISNSLSAIQSLIDSGEIDKANQYIAKFSLLIRYVLKYSDKSATRLSDELKIIELNIELEQLRFSNSFIFSKRIGEGIDTNELYIPPLITQPFIENAIWHGLLPLKDKRIPELVLKIERMKDNIVISIIDNGVGRHSASENSSISNNPFKESKGTQLIQKRIENLGQLYHGKEAKVEFIDLYDFARPSGTCVNIIFPVEMLTALEEKT